MKKIVLIALLFCGMTGIVNAQYAWTQKTNLGGFSRLGAIGFSIGDKGYAGTGMDSAQGMLGDFWEYDPATNAWTQKADYGGTARFNAVSFVVGNLGYVGSGSDAYPVYDFRNDFWAYNPTTNTWAQIADFIGVARYGMMGFNIDSIGYCGIGWENGTFYNDFYQYSPVSNTWTQKASFPGTARTGARSFAIGRFGYIGTGYDGNNVLNDFYKYNPATDSWSQIPNIPGAPILDAVSFVICNQAYVGLGTTVYNTYNSSNCITNFWIYNPSSNAWSAGPTFTGQGRSTGKGFSIGNIGYIFSGTNSVNYFNDVWALGPMNGAITVNPNPACINTSINFGTNLIGATSYLWNFGDGDTSSFINPLHVYSTTGNFNVTLQVYNSGLCIDTILLNTSVNILPSAQANFTGDSLSGCPPLTTHFTNNSTNATSYLWNFGDSSLSYSYQPTHVYFDTGFYTITLIAFNQNGCNDTLIMPDYIHVGTPFPPHASFVIDTFSGCKPVVVHFTNTSTNATSYSWHFGDGGTSTLTNPIHSYSGTNTYHIWMVAYDTNSCGVLTDTTWLTQHITVFSPPPHPIITVNGNYLTSSATSGNEWFYYATPIPGAYNQTYFVITNGCYSVLVTDSNGCTATSDTVCFTTGIKDINIANAFSIFPNPNSGTFNIESNNLMNEYTVQIIDVLGRIIYTEFVKNVSNKELHVSVSPGIYFLKILSSDQQLVRKISIE